MESPLAAVVKSSEKARVLLLDDDSAFRGAIADCLTENGYTVVALQHGGEAVREVLAGEFALVLCDLMMPGLPGDMFYRAVERIRPALCQRFIFMTGQQADVRANDFIKGFEGFVLRKPFPLKNLLDLVALVEVRHTLHSVFDGIPTDPDGAEVWPRTDHFSAEATLSAQVDSVAKILARASKETAIENIADVTVPSEPAVRAEGGSTAIVVAVLTLLILLGTGLWNRYSNARNRVAAALDERRAHEVEWAAISKELENGVAVRAKIELAQTQMAHIAAEQKKPRWSAAFRSIPAAADSGIELREMWARGEKLDIASGEVRISGVASGVQPRLQADRFRQAVEENLKGIGNGRPVKTRFENLENATGQIGQERVSFVVAATVGSMEPSTSSGTEGR